MKSFYRRMAEEKGLIENRFEVQVNGVTHYMVVDQIIEVIEMTSENQKALIKDTFSKIDFQNGDLMHYIKFLAKAFIATNY